jgi:hypothetical protein
MVILNVIFNVLGHGCLRIFLVALSQAWDRSIVGTLWKHHLSGYKEWRMKYKLNAVSRVWNIKLK